MNDQEKLEKVKEIVTEWALDDDANGTDALVGIMEALEFNPYPAEDCV